MGLYRSYPVTVIMNIPFASCVVTVNENMKTLLKPWERSNPHLWYFLCAGIAGGIAGVITNPLDVVKTRLQTQEIKPSCAKLRELWELDSSDTKKGFKSGTSDQPCSNIAKQECEFELKQVRYNDFNSALRFIYRTEGLRAFSKGIFPRMCINVPSTALSWGTYEIMKTALGKLWE